MAVRSIQKASEASQRRCLRCGHAGAELQRRSAGAEGGLGGGMLGRPGGRARRADEAAGVVDGVVLRCPVCGEDLYARPPRSYAELEGLTRVKVDAWLDVRAEPAAVRTLRRHRRWLAAGLVLAAVGLAAVVYVLL